MHEEETKTESQSSPSQDANVMECPRCHREVYRHFEACPKCNSILFFEQKSTQERLGNIAKYRIPQLLLREQGYLLESIYKGEKLAHTMIYCLVYSLLFFALYGAILGSLDGARASAFMAGKVPGLFFLTLAISTPLLFGMNIFLGSTLSFSQTTALLLLITYQTGMILVCLSPILLLFLVFSDGSGFIQILNIAFFVLAGGIGISLLWKVMDYCLARSGATSGSFFIKIWSFIYIFIALQLAWNLKIFGDLSNLPLLKQLGIEGNFYMAIFQLIKKLAGIE